MECCSNVARRKKVDLSDTQKIMSRGYKDLMWLHSHSYGRLKNNYYDRQQDSGSVCTLCGMSTSMSVNA